MNQLRTRLSIEEYRERRPSERLRHWSTNPDGHIFANTVLDVRYMISLTSKPIPLTEENGVEQEPHQVLRLIVCMPVIILGNHSESFR